MSIAAKKANSTRFGKISTAGKTQLTPYEWAILMLQAGFPADPKVISEGLGTLDAEDSFGTTGGDGVHVGGWQEEPSYGSLAERMDPLKSTQSAYRHWKAAGNSFYADWGKWEEQQSGVNGARDLGPKHLSVATEAVKAYTHGVVGGTIHSGTVKKYSGIPGLEQGEKAVSGAESATEFLAEVAEALLDFRKLGQLAAEAFSWFLRLILKAIWDYVVAPLWHWGERAVSWYWENFFGTGAEQGSGFGYVLRSNAGAVTITFWALGYAILWSNGQSLSPVTREESMLGQGVKGVSGLIARRNLVKPTQVKDKTPKKPKPKHSVVMIERVQEYSTQRNRQVRVSSKGQELASGRKVNNVSSERSGAGEHTIPRPQKNVILPPGVKTQAASKAKASAKPRGAGMGASASSGNGTKSLASVS